MSLYWHYWKKCTIGFTWLIGILNRTCYYDADIGKSSEVKNRYSIWLLIIGLIPGNLVKLEETVYLSASIWYNKK